MHPKDAFLVSALVTCMAGVMPFSQVHAAAICTAGSPSVSGIVNTYYTGVGTVSAGTTTLSLGALDARGSTTPIAAGDRILILQMQDATINYNNSISYGDGSTGRGSLSIGNSGSYEYAVVQSVSGGTITLHSPLAGTYTEAVASATRGQRTYQVIRVPSYKNVTLAGTVTAPAWNGATGGVVAIDAQGMTVSGSVSVTGLGFRGGWRGIGLAGTSATMIAIPPTVTPAAAVTYNATRVSMSTTVPSPWSDSNSLYHGGYKGEGIAGTPSSVASGTDVSGTQVLTGSFYPPDPSAPSTPSNNSGNITIGAPGNAGGGGSSTDAGGGGGSNAGAGGRGGTWSAWMTPTGLGAPDYSSSLSQSRLFMGGGGGGGAAQNNTTTHAWPGTAGGGIVMLRAGTLSGSGSVTADGASVTKICSGANGGDGNGGTGAGGTILIQSGGGGSSLVLSAHGGNQNQTPYGIYAGGGGGGAIYTSTAPASTSVLGGTIPRTAGIPQAGCFNAGNSQVTLETYGVSPKDGLPGIAATGASTPPQMCELVANVSLTKTNTPGINGEVDQAVDKVVSGSTAVYTITVTNGGPDAANNSVLTDPASSGLTCTSASCVSAVGASCPASTGAALLAELQGAGAAIPVLPSGGSITVTVTCSVN